MSGSASHQPESFIAHGCETPGDPMRESLIGEHVRLMMVSTAACSAIFWATHLGTIELAPILVVTCILILGVLTSDRFAGPIRLALVLVVMIGLAVKVGANGDWLGTHPFFSPAVMLGCLGVLAARDTVIVLRSRVGGISNRTIGVGIIVAAALCYLIVVPTVASFLDQFQERPTSFAVEELTTLEVLRIRSSKLLVFAIFAYFGACVGSFLNVVAASAPRGESIALRSSACPKCGTLIRRIDNLPIISYLMLHGRCRACNVPIPIRYLAVELIVMGIFASLFLYELVTGAANVPGFRHYPYTGILWILLYTKWPVVGIYFYHVTLFSCLLMFALMEIDGLRCPRFMAAGIIGLFAALAIIAPVLQPVALDDQLQIRLISEIQPWILRAMTCFAGGLIGWLIAVIASRARSTVSPAAPWILLGVTLGWQATITIAILWIVASIAINQLQLPARTKWLVPTAILFSVSSLHHPVWKWLTALW